MVPDSHAKSGFILLFAFKKNKISIVANELQINSYNPL